MTRNFEICPEKKAICRFINQYMLEAAKGMVVKARSKLAMQLQLQKMMQGPDQPIQTYVATLCLRRDALLDFLICLVVYHLESYGKSAFFTDNMTF